MNQRERQHKQPLPRRLPIAGFAFAAEMSQQVKNWLPLVVPDQERTKLTRYVLDQWGIKRKDFSARLDALTKALAPAARLEPSVMRASQPHLPSPAALMAASFCSPLHMLDGTAALDIDELVNLTRFIDGMVVAETFLDKLIVQQDEDNTWHARFKGLIEQPPQRSTPSGRLLTGVIAALCDINPAVEDSDWVWEEAFLITINLAFYEAKQAPLDFERVLGQLKQLQSMGAMSPQLVRAISDRVTKLKAASKG